LGNFLGEALKTGWKNQRRPLPGLKKFAKKKPERGERGGGRRRRKKIEGATGRELKKTEKKGGKAREDGVEDHGDEVGAKKNGHKYVKKTILLS